jgi:acyl dehydratase
MKDTEFGQPLVNSMFTVALLVGMSVLETTHGTAVANLGFEEVAFPAPVFYGDTIHAESEVVAARESKSRPDAGIVTFEHRAYNQDGTLVCSARRNALMSRRPT